MSQRKLYSTINPLYLFLIITCISNIFCDSCRFTDDIIVQDDFWNILPERTPCSSLCPGLIFRATCSCNLFDSGNARLECSGSNASILVKDIEQLDSCQIHLSELIVTNSNLTRLYHLPSGMYNVEELVLINTGIDLETLNESSELLRRLKILRIIAENLTEVCFQ